MLVALCFGMFYGRNLSGDVWWHLKTGQWIVESHRLPFNDPFSYTARNPIILHGEEAAVALPKRDSSIFPSSIRRRITPSSISNVKDLLGSLGRGEILAIFRELLLSTNAEGLA